MIEKRFKIADYPTDIIDVATDKKYPVSSYATHMEIICDLLNDFNDENERLKRHYNSLSHNNGLLYDECTNKINVLKKENEQLKQKLRVKERLIGAYEQYINDLKEDGVLDD